MASVASTIFVRIALGVLLKRLGPVSLQSGLLTFGAVWRATASTVSVPLPGFMHWFVSSLAAQDALS